MASWGVSSPDSFLTLEPSVIGSLKHSCLFFCHIVSNIQRFIGTVYCISIPWIGTCVYNLLRGRVLKTRQEVIIMREPRIFMYDSELRMSNSKPAWRVIRWIRNVRDPEVHYEYASDKEAWYDFERYQHLDRTVRVVIQSASWETHGEATGL